MKEILITIAFAAVGTSTLASVDYAAVSAGRLAATTEQFSAPRDGIILAKGKKGKAPKKTPKLT